MSHHSPDNIFNFSFAIYIEAIKWWLLAIIIIASNHHLISIKGIKSNVSLDLYNLTYISKAWRRKHYFVGYLFSWKDRLLNSPFAHNFPGKRLFFSLFYFENCGRPNEKGLEKNEDGSFTFAFFQSRGRINGKKASSEMRTYWMEFDGRRTEWVG